MLYVPQTKDRQVQTARFRDHVVQVCQAWRTLVKKLYSAYYLLMPTLANQVGTRTDSVCVAGDVSCSQVRRTLKKLVYF